MAGAEHVGRAEAAARNLGRRRMLWRCQLATVLARSLGCGFAKVEVQDLVVFSLDSLGALDDQKFGWLPKRAGL